MPSARSRIVALIVGAALTPSCSGCEIPSMGDPAEYVLRVENRCGRPLVGFVSESVTEYASFQHLPAGRTSDLNATWEEASRGVLAITDQMPYGSDFYRPTSSPNWCNTSR